MSSNCLIDLQHGSSVFACLWNFLLCHRRGAFKLEMSPNDKTLDGRGVGIYSIKEESVRRTGNLIRSFCVNISACHCKSYETFVL
jgi:hypothetical protein